MSRMANRLKNLPHFKDASEEMLERAAVAADRRATGEILGETIKASEIAITLAGLNLSVEARSVRGNSIGAWVSGSDGDLRFLPWTAISAIRFVNPRVVVRR